MKSLTEQAKEIAKKFWDTEGGFVFCNKEKSIFCTARYATLVYDNFAFVIHFEAGCIKDFEKILAVRMKEYCGVHQLVFTEK